MFTVTVHFQLSNSAKYFSIQKVYKTKLETLKWPSIATSKTVHIKDGRESNKSKLLRSLPNVLRSPETL